MTAALSRLAFTLLTAGLLVASCSGQPSSGETEQGGAVAASAEEWFTERARESGLDFVHFNGMTGRFQFPEVIPPGVALLDYDGDGDLDLFVAQGRMLGTRALGEALHQPQAPLKSRLYRNDLQVHTDGTPTLRFTDVTEASGIVVLGYAMGAATGDFDF